MHVCGGKGKHQGQRKLVETKREINRARERKEARERGGTDIERESLKEGMRSYETERKGQREKETN